jgi:hypothetical protein
MTDSDATQPPQPKPPQRVRCALCRQELPLEAALSVEGEDYVLWFCGSDCLAEWRAAQVPDDGD